MGHHRRRAGDKLTAWVVYPERSDKAPVVLVVHEIFGLSDWVRSVADQLAAEGFIAIAPDLLSGKAPGGKGSQGLSPDDARRLIAGLDPAEVTRRLNAAALYATSLPAALPKFAVIGFCWGGGVSFSYASSSPASARPSCSTAFLRPRVPLQGSGPGARPVRPTVNTARTGLAPPEATGRVLIGVSRPVL